MIPLALLVYLLSPHPGAGSGVPPSPRYLSLVVLPKVRSRHSRDDYGMNAASEINSSIFIFKYLKKKKQEGSTPDFMGIIPWDGSELRFPFK